MSKRWLAHWRDSGDDHKPILYHLTSRIVDRNRVIQVDEREKFRAIMRMQEKFTGCRVLAYCVMSNHFHILLEVPPMPERPDGSGKPGLSDAELLKRLAVYYGEGDVAEVATELEESRKAGDLEWVEKIHARYTYRMYDLSEFMKTLLARFTRWFNRTHERTGTLWEERFKSVIVESGDAARMIAAYIDLNPVRAGMVTEAAEYRWSSYGEAIGGGPKGNGKKAREGLVRAVMSDRGAGFDAELWKDASKTYRYLLGLALQRKPAAAAEVVRSENVAKSQEMDEGGSSAGRDSGYEDDPSLPDLGMVEMLRHRVRYFTDGAVIGSREFVNEAFANARDRFSEKRKDGARKLRGNGKAAAGKLWSARDLRVRI